MGGTYTPRLGSGLLADRLGPGLGGAQRDPNQLSGRPWGYPEPGAVRPMGGQPPAGEGGYDWAWNQTNLGDHMNAWPGLPFDPSSSLGGSWYQRPGVGWVPEGWQDPRDAAGKAERDREAQWRQRMRERNSRGRSATILTSGRGLIESARVNRPTLLGM